MAEPGGLFRVVVGHGPVMRGNFVELDPPRRLVFTFGWETNPPRRVTPSGVDPRRGDADARRGWDRACPRHYDMPAQHAPDHRNGWGYFVGDRLKAAIGD